MMVRAAPPEHFGWLCERAGCVLTPNAQGIEAVDDSGRVRGMVLYDQHTETSAIAHMAVDAPIVWRSLLKPAFRYPFNEGKRALLLGIIPSHNVRSVQLARRFGFREAHRIRDGWAHGDDLIVFEMRREECRYLGRC